MTSQQMQQVTKLIKNNVSQMLVIHGEFNETIKKIIHINPITNCHV